MKTLRTILRQGRTSSGLTFRELEKKLKIPASNLCQIEKGAIIDPTFKTVKKICKFFGVDMYEVRG